MCTHGRVLFLIAGALIAKAAPIFRWAFWWFACKCAYRFARAGYVELPIGWEVTGALVSRCPRCCRQYVSRSDYCQLVDEDNTP